MLVSGSELSPVGKGEPLETLRVEGGEGVGGGEEHGRVNQRGRKGRQQLEGDRAGRGVHCSPQQQQPGFPLDPQPSPSGSQHFRWGPSISDDTFDPLELVVL